MRKRIVICSVLLITVAVAIVGGYWLLMPRPRIDQASLDKIQFGMTEREVIAIIGVPAGNHGLGEGEMHNPLFLIQTIDEQAGMKAWLGQDNAIVIAFDANGKVTEKRLHGMWRPYESHFDMLCQKLHIRDGKQRPMHW